jgi:hypothetical protein
LIFELEANEEDCGTISFKSDSSLISVSDTWAKNEDVEWRIKNFETSAEEHGLSLDYVSELSSEDGEVDICVSGSKLGEYHGVILLSEAVEGVSSSRMGIWIKVNIVGEGEKKKVASSGEGGSSGGSVSSGISGESEASDSGVVSLQINPSEVEEGGDSGENDGGRFITGRVIGDSEGVGGYWILVALGLIGVLAVYIYRRKKG